MAQQNLAIASKIINGRLDADAVVSAMLSHYLDMADRTERGKTTRPCRKLSEDLAMEFALTLGRGDLTQSIRW